MQALLDIVTPVLEMDEGLRLKAYLDKYNNLTIGYGHNLTAKGISKNIAKAILLEDITDSINDCTNHIDFWNDIDVVRQSVIVNMCFNMGIGGLMAFETMLKCLKAKDYEGAANAIEKSLENEEVPNRMHPLIIEMRTGKIES